MSMEFLARSSLYLRFGMDNYSIFTVIMPCNRDCSVIIFIVMFFYISKVLVTSGLLDINVLFLYYSRSSSTNFTPSKYMCMLGVFHFAVNFLNDIME